MVTTYAFLATASLLALAVAALCLWPLRKAAPRLFGALVAVVPLLALALYLLVGTPAALDATALEPQQAPQSLDEAVAQLEAALERDPAQPEGWALLARSHAAQGRFEESREAWARVLELMPDEPDVLVEAAQSRAQADPQRRFDDEALDMLQRAARLDPGNQRAPWFIGVVQRQRGQDADAAATWEALLPRVEPATAAALRQQIAEARQAAGLPPLAESAPAARDPAAASAGDGLRVRVALDPDFAARVRLRGDAQVFVIARVPDGPPMPVAVERHPVSALPLDIVLDDDDSLMPTQKLSALQDVEILARLSASGSANRQDGDVESIPVRVQQPAAAPVELVIGKSGP